MFYIYIQISNAKDIQNSVLNESHIFKDDQNIKLRKTEMYINKKFEIHPFQIHLLNKDLIKEKSTIIKLHQLSLWN